MHTIEFTCGATLVIKTCNPDAGFQQLITFLPTRMCPQCQLQAGDITPQELDILESNEPTYFSSLRDEGTDKS